MRTKEFLSTRGVEYEGVNVKDEPERLDEAARRFGIKALPLVVKGDRCVNGQNMAEVAKLVGLEFDDRPQLPAGELVRRTDAFMAAAQRYLAQLPEARFRERLPYRDWDYRKLAHHVFHISDVFVHQMRGEGEGPAAAFEMPVPDDLTSFGACLAYGDAMRAQLQAWWDSKDRAGENDVFDSRAGRRTMHQILERTCWHIGQHVRQVEHMVKHDGLAPDGPLTEAMLAKLPLPTNIWSDL